MSSDVLFVCLGNICRSPMAEGVLRGRAAAAGLTLGVDSAGTGDWHAGEPPYPPAIRAAEARGYDIAGQRARQVTAEDFTRFGLMLAMDASNMERLEQLRPADARADLRMFMSYAPETGATEVPDPYYTRDFNEALDLIEAGVTGLIEALRK